VRILLVEDEKRLADLIRRALVEESNIVEIIHDGVAALEAAREDRFDAVILDVMLPGIDGFRIARELRGDGHALPILMLTARDTLPDRLEGFEAGADDYLTKPFALEELWARLRAITRRGGSAAPDQHLQVADVVMDLEAHEVTRAGRPVILPPREYALLEYLMRNPGRALTRTMILERVWDYSFDSIANVVDASIRRLRRAIGDDEEPQLIQTVRGVGYRMRAP
jgi:DNA-binding response OmpR family regulator